VTASVVEAGLMLRSMGHEVSDTQWPTPQSFQEDFLAFWSLGAAQDIASVRQATGLAADETNFEPFSLRMAQNASQLSQEEVGAVMGRLMAASAAYANWMTGFDIVLSPVFTSPPSPLGYLRGDVPFDTLRERLIEQVGYTLIHNVAGAPAISLPLGRTTGGLPIGVQVSGAVGADGLLLEVAYLFEEAMPWRSYRARLG
jgi:amidase